MTKVSTKWVLRSDGGFLVCKGSGGHMRIEVKHHPEDARLFESKLAAMCIAEDWLQTYNVDWAEAVEILLKEVTE